MQTTVRYELLLGQEARETMRALPVEYRRNIGRRLDALQEDLAGDVKKLSGAEANTGCESAHFVCSSP